MLQGDKILAMNNNYLKQKTPKEITTEIAKRIRTIRKRMKISQQALSEKSDVSLGSIKRFENSGEISLMSLVKIAIALDCEDEIESLFTQRRFNSIQEIIDEQS